jgi:hypothetical protein
MKNTLLKILGASFVRLQLVACEQTFHSISSGFLYKIYRTVKLRRSLAGAEERNTPPDELRTSDRMPDEAIDTST